MVCFTLISSCLFLLLYLEFAKGTLLFHNLLHDPRVYEGAPPGVHVTTIVAYDPGRQSVMYNLLDVGDDKHFAIDPTSGNISTAQQIDRKVGESYDIIVVAISQGVTKVRETKIVVSSYNEHSPEFEHDVYRGEIHVRAPVGSTVLRVRANDLDTVPYNALVYYVLDEPLDSRGRFLLDPQTGVLTLARSLELAATEPVVELRVVAVDGGSPSRSDKAKVEVLVKTISEPRDVRSANATGSTVHVCWTRPEYGQVLGYIVKYREVENPHGAPSFLNLTSNATSKCATLVELKIWTDYEFRVYGWNRFETGQGSAVGSFGARPDYCRMNICQHGECHVLNKAPGYHCDCAEGYYGDVCDKFDVCSIGPCKNMGICRNISSNKYRCDCSSTFSGQNCSDFNPCAMRPSPCLNGGRCESTEAHVYQCYCTKGYYGTTCESFNPCSMDPCRNGARCKNVSEVDYDCNCRAGYTGKQCEVDIDECASSPCKHGGSCRDAINAYHCRCAPGYRGKRCHLIEHCPGQTVSSSKGLFRWNSTAHGRAHLIECPFGSIFPDRESATGYAKRRCYLLSNGSVAWGKMDLSSCREEGFKNAEDLTSEYWMLTEDPRHLNVEKLKEATRKIESVMEYAIYDKKIAHNMLSIVSNMLAINESQLQSGDANGTAANKVTDLVDKFASEVKLERGESITLETENLVVKAVSWDPETSDLVDDELSFAVHYQARNRREFSGKSRYRPPPPQSFWEEMQDETTTSFYNDAELTIPIEALLMAQNQTYQELRIKFVAYRNDKFFREKQTVRWRQCKGNVYQRRYNCLEPESTGFSGRRVLQASISNATITNLSDPVVYVLPSPLNVRVFCAFWKEQDRVWSTEGLITNQSGNSTSCFASHMTSFSLLLDPTPNEGISPEHMFTLSLISYIGCGLSMLGLVFTIITYSLFRCLNRDYPGQILLHLCVSMLLMNAVFVGGSQRGNALGGVDICVTVAVLIHYFLLSTLAWMCVEATNMYQLLIHVFASLESHFMLKRAILAWGIPFIIVGVTVLMDWSVYYNQNEYCMLSASNPYVYYISFLGPSCLILLINLTVFLMVTKVLFTPRDNVSAKKPPQCAGTKKEKFLVTTAQVRGAFTVMVLLGVSWVFGAFAFGEARLVFQYVFCISNSLQGFLIFLVRCLQYPEARSAWVQLLKTGTFKKYRGMVPPGSWSGNSNSSHHQKQNGHSTTTRLGSADATNAVAFNTNFWGSKGEECTKDAADLPPDDVTVDYVNRSAQLLTFSSAMKDDKSRRTSKHKSLSRSGSETSQDPRGDPQEMNHYVITTYGLNPSVVVETADSDDDNTKAFQQEDALGSAQLGSLPAEPKSRSSYGSSIAGYIDEEAERRDKIAANTLDRKIFASKASSVFGHIKPDSPPELDKQNSWPRTLSSFLGGKEPLKFTVSDHAHPQPRRFPPCDHALGECHASCQIIPLQVRPTTPSSSSSSVPLCRRDSPLSHSCHPSPMSHPTNAACSPTTAGDTASLPNRHHHHHQHVPMHVTRTWRTSSLDAVADELPERDQEGELAPEQPYGVWERQGIVSPNKGMFIDSEASRL